VHNQKYKGDYWKNYCTKKLGVNLSSPIFQVGHTVFSKNLCHACRIFCVQRQRQSLLKINDKIYCQCDLDYDCVFKNCPDYTDKDVISLNHKNIIENHELIAGHNTPKTKKRFFDFESS